MTFVVVAACGAAGAVSRYVVTYWVTLHVEARWPLRSHDVNWGTHLVNVSGSFAIGLAVGLGLSATSDGLLRYAIATGFLGGYTTFSTWMYETWRLWERGGRSIAFLNAAGALAAGVAATASGFALGSVLV